MIQIESTLPSSILATSFQLLETCDHVDYDKTQFSYFQLMDSKARKALFENASRIQDIRDIGKTMIMDRINNGKLGMVDDILDSIISTILESFYILVGDHPKKPAASPKSANWHWLF